MAKLQRYAPRVFARVRVPRYPRVVGIGTILLASACCRSGGSGADEAPDAANPTTLPAGVPVVPFDEASVDAGAAATSTDASAASNDAGAASKEAGPDRRDPRTIRPGGAPPNPYRERK